jgi:hypothetical protein
MIAFSRLHVTWQYECILHCEHGCSVDTTQLMQLITVRELRSLKMVVIFVYVIVYNVSTNVIEMRVFTEHDGFRGNSTICVQ